MNAPLRIKTILIDDEISAIQLLEEMLKKIEGVMVAGHAHTISDGLNLLIRQRPDILFLDIRLNEENGFELIKKLKDYDIDPFIVMVTGYDQFGLEAIKAGAFDYLLKPVDPDELLKVISRYRQKQALASRPDPARKIRFNTQAGFILVHPDEVLYCKAEANYTDIFLTGERKYTVSQNIGKIEEVFSPPQFFRISRSAIINTGCLAEINRGKKLCILAAGNSTFTLAISQDRIKGLESTFIQ